VSELYHTFAFVIIKTKNKMKFTDKIIALEEEIKNYLLSKVKDGEKLEFVNKKQIAESGNDILFELPQVDCENRYDEIVRYCIVAIERTGETFNLHGTSLSENFGESGIFSFYELSANELCFIADFIESLN